MFRDQKNEIKVITATAGTAIDTQGFGSLTICAVGTKTGAAAITLTDCDTDSGDFVAVEPQYVINDVKTTIAADGDPFSVGYNGKHRYVKFAVQGLQDATFVAVLGYPHTAPVDLPADADKDVL